MHTRAQIAQQTADFLAKKGKAIKVVNDLNEVVALKQYDDSPISAKATTAQKIVPITRTKLDPDTFSTKRAASTEGVARYGRRYQGVAQTKAGYQALFIPLIDKVAEVH